MNKSCVACIGGGNMALSLLMGLKGKGFNPEQLRVSDPSKERRTLLDEAGITTFSSNEEAIENAQVIIIAVKPQIVGPVLENLREAVSKDQLIISIAAGVPLSALRGWLGPSSNIVRCMPNTPALKGAGITGMYTDSNLSNAETSLANSVLGAVGKTLWLESETQLDAVTAVSGSEPTYYFYLTECMIEAGIELGLDPDTSKLLATETAYGAAIMLRDGENEAKTLRVNVTSPGGTTEAALNYMKDHRFSETVKQAIKAAAARSVELGIEFSNSKT